MDRAAAGVEGTRVTSWSDSPADTASVRLAYTASQPPRCVASRTAMGGALLTLLSSYHPADCWPHVCRLTWKTAEYLGGKLAAPWLCSAQCAAAACART